MSSSSNHSLSICMIVKNEATLLGRCLESVRSIAEEIIVVDTGSTDASPEVAESKGAKVIMSDWRDDFSYSRNISLDHATCDWILWLDADDVVPAESLAGLKDLTSRKPDRVYGLVVRNEKPSGTGSEFVQARIFPNRPEIRFERRIHEQMMPSAFRLGLQLESTAIVVEHHGYADGEQLKMKATRNAKMLLEEYDPSCPDPTSAVEIADSYTIMEDKENAEIWYHNVLAVPHCESVHPQLASQAFYGLGNICNTAERFDEAASHFQKSHALCPERTDALYCLAVSQELAGNISDSIQSLKKIPGAEHKPVIVGVNFRETELKAVLRLGRLYRENERTEELLSHCESALKRYPARPEVRNMVGQSYMRMGKLMEALHAFEASLQIAIEGNIDAYLGLCMIYTKAGKKELVEKTLLQIEGLFSGTPRYWAFRKVAGVDGPIPSMVDEARVNEELEFLHTTYAI